MTSAIEAALAIECLTALGGFHPDKDDGLPGVGTLMLVGPGPGFWPHFRAAPEYADGAADPLDRWSSRVVSAVAAGRGGRALFPFGGPPWHPFIAWARRSGWAHPSPVGMLVHARAGLWVSYRGAVALPDRLDLPPPPPSPCATCAAKPCLAACPVGAMSGAGYDVAACHGFLDTGPGAACMMGGCAVRAACPVSQAWGREAAQSAFHMAAFH